jgi:hypothetical protein
MQVIDLDMGAIGYLHPDDVGSMITSASAIGPGHESQFVDSEISVEDLQLDKLRRLSPVPVTKIRKQSLRLDEQSAEQVRQSSASSVRRESATFDSVTLEDMALFEQEDQEENGEAAAIAGGGSISLVKSEMSKGAAVEEAEGVEAAEGAEEAKGGVKEQAKFEAAAAGAAAAGAADGAGAGADAADTHPHAHGIHHVHADQERELHGNEGKAETVLPPPPMPPQGAPPVRVLTTPGKAETEEILMPPPSPPLTCGMLWKKGSGKNKLMGRTNWKQRFFFIGTAEDGSPQLVYAKEELGEEQQQSMMGKNDGQRRSSIIGDGKAKEKGRLSLRGGRVMRVPKKQSKYDFHFQIVTETRTMDLRASTEDELAMWEVVLGRYFLS